MSNIIRICERDSQPYDVVIVNDRGVFNNGPLGFATTVEDAKAAAIRLLPSKQTNGASWELRTLDGVYSKI